MKREEKNMLSRQKIMDSARREFAEKGYGLGSVNTICGGGGISKGILYHYFADKDELYLSCVRACFDGLTEHLRTWGRGGAGTVRERLDRYFAARLDYFSRHPEEQRLFCGAVISPPAQLREEIAALKAGFDSLNVEILDDILSGAALRPDVTRQEVIDTFRQYQDFVNARYQMADLTPAEIEERELDCRRAVLILLYGVLGPGEERTA